MQGAVPVSCSEELSRKVMLSIYWWVYVPTVICDHELWVVTERLRSQIQAGEISFLRRVFWLFLSDRVRSLVIWEGLSVELLLLHIKRSLLRWHGHLVRMPPWWTSLVRHVGDPEEVPGHAGRTIFLCLPGKTCGEASTLNVVNPSLNSVLCSLLSPFMCYPLPNKGHYAHKTLKKQLNWFRAVFKL